MDAYAEADKAQGALVVALREDLCKHVQTSLLTVGGRDGQADASGVRQRESYLDFSIARGNEPVSRPPARQGTALKRRAS